MKPIGWDMGVPDTSTIAIESMTVWSVGDGAKDTQLDCGPQAVWPAGSARLARRAPLSVRSSSHWRVQPRDLRAAAPHHSCPDAPHRVEMGDGPSAKLF